MQIMNKNRVNSWTKTVPYIIVVILDYRLNRGILVCVKN